MVNLRSRKPGGGLTIDEYIDVYYYPDTEKVGSQIQTNSIHVLGLKDILLTLDMIADLASLHQASQPLMFYAVECMRPTIYDYSTTLLSNMKHQLSECNMGRVVSLYYADWVVGLPFGILHHCTSRMDL